MKDMILQYVQYNLWANSRIVSVFQSQPDEWAERHVPGSFPSARLTLLHIWDAEFLWMKRLDGVSLGAFPSKNFTGNMAAVYAGLLGNSGDLLEYVQSKPDAFFDETLVFKTLSYGEQSEKARNMIWHCMNHSTFHRGQLVTIARQLGIEKIPPTDLVFFLRERA